MQYQKKKGILSDFMEAIGNFFIFLPYFFSITTLFKTLFSPWKNLTTKRTKRSLSFEDIFNTFMFNFISRGVGVVMRISVIIFYVLVQILFTISIPIIIIIFFISLPITLLFRSITQDENETKENLKEKFVKTHTMAEQNKAAVEEWFEYYYQHHIIKRPWWKLDQLFKVPPLARDWAQGYTPQLDEFSDDLTDSSYQLRIRSHIIGREKESSMIERVLTQSEEANVVLVGEDGVGKHTMIDALARRIYEGRTNTHLAYKRLLKLNMEKILSVHTDLVKREDFFEELLLEAQAAKNVILLIDNFDHYVSNDQGKVDLTSSIDKFASTTFMQVIGITTPFLYEKYIYNNEKIRNIFTKIDVEEISKNNALYILFHKAIEFEIKYKLIIPYETLLAVIDKSENYINTIPFPEKALQLLDWVCTYNIESAKRTIVTPGIVDTVVSNRTHVPTTLSDEIKKKLLHLEDLISTSIIGQEQAIQSVSSTLRRSFLMIGKRKKPISTFLFLGPTGVGKTQTAKTIAKVFFESQEKMIRFDMSLYQSKDEIPKLIGSIETLNPGQLTNAVRENPYGVLLIDEIEKANKDLLNIFLTILDEGYFTDGFGQRVDCKNLIIVATSNAGSDVIHQMLEDTTTSQGIGQSSNNMINYLVEQRLFSPEFLNRFDGVILFKPLQGDQAITIAKGLVKTLSDEIRDKYGVNLNIADEKLRAMIDGQYNIQFGARNLERIIRTQIEDTVAKKLLEGELKAGQTYNY